MDKHHNILIVSVPVFVQLEPEVRHEKHKCGVSANQVWKQMSQTQTDWQLLIS